MKKYIKPETEIIRTWYEGDLLQGSKKPGVNTDDELVEEFYEEDVSYSKPVFTDIWADEDDGGQDKWY